MRFCNGRQWASGFLNITYIDPAVSYLLTGFTILVVMNAYNLIDGVDGLAAGFGFIASIAFSYWFYKTGDQPLALLAIGLAGALLGFLVYNFQPAKLFMGLFFALKSI